MYELTIDTDAVSRTTRHADPGEARQALLAHAVTADLYLHVDRGTDPAGGAAHASAIHLLRLDPTARQPRCVGTATITTPSGDAQSNPHPSTTGATAS